jgi:hypothetical protein
MRFPRSDSSSGREIEGLKIAVNDEGNGLSGLPVPVGEGGEEKKEVTEGDAKETLAMKVAVDRSVELLLSPPGPANSGTSKDTGPWLVDEGSTFEESSITDGARDADVLGSAGSSSEVTTASGSFSSPRDCVSTGNVDVEDDVVNGIGRFEGPSSDVEGSSSKVDSLLTTSLTSVGERSGAEVGRGSGAASVVGGSGGLCSSISVCVG